MANTDIVPESWAEGFSDGSKVAMDLFLLPLSARTQDRIALLL